MQAQIYYITLEQLKKYPNIKAVLSEDMGSNYYWSDDWSEEFYIFLAKMGFISITHETQNELLLLPELQYEYGVLDFKNLHISKHVQKLIKQKKYELRFNTKLYEVIANISMQHSSNWFKGKYVELIKKLYAKQHDNFQIISVELFSKAENKLIAGEVGYIIGKVYSSLTGFSLRDREYNNCGTLQLVLLAQYLQMHGFSFWNLGHPHLEYKSKLGSITYSRKDFLKRWDDATHQKMIEIKSSSN